MTAAAIAHDEGGTGYVVTCGWDKTIRVWDPSAGAGDGREVSTTTTTGKCFAATARMERFVCADSTADVAYDVEDLARGGRPTVSRRSSMRFQTRAIAWNATRDGFVAASAEGRCAVDPRADEDAAAEVRVQVSSKDGGRVERGDGVSGARARVSSDARDVRHGWGRWVREFLGRRGEKTIGASRSISTSVSARVFTERRDFSHREFVRARGSRERQTSRRHLSQIGQRGRGSSEKSAAWKSASRNHSSFISFITHLFPHASTRVVVVVIVVDDDAR